MNNLSKISKSFTLTVVLVLLGWVTLLAQQKGAKDLGTLTLKQCISIAQEQSSEADAARFALTASKWRYQSYRADLFPSFSLSGNAPNYNKSISSYRKDDGSFTFSSSKQSQAEASVSLEQNILPTGGTVSLSSGINRLGIFKGENTYSWQSTPMVIEYNQPLFQFNRLKWRNKTEPLQLRIAKKEFVQNMENIAQSVSRGFFDVYLAKINLENAKFNVTRNDSIYQISKGRYEVGTIAENDLLQSKLRYKNAQSALSTAKIEYDRALNDFKIQLGYSTDVDFNLNPPKDLPKVPVNIEKAKQLALNNNSESLGYELNEVEAKQTLEQAKSDAGFSANVRANYGLNRTASEFDMLYDDLKNRQFLSVGFDIPIFNWGKQRAQVNAARNQQKQVANSIKVQRRRFVQEIDYTVSKFTQLRQQALLAAQSDTIAQRRYQVAQNRYKIGKIEITDVFNAQRDKDSSRQSYVRALRDFWTGLYNLRELTLYDFRDGNSIDYAVGI